MNNNFLKINNDFIVYDIYEVENDLTEYFFVCQNYGEEKTLKNSTILNIFEGNFLSILQQQLDMDEDSRLSLDDFNNLVWKYTCSTLNINLGFKDIFSDKVLSLNKELSKITEDDILNLNIYVYGDFYNIYSKELIKNVSFIVYKDFNNRLNLTEREHFISSTHDIAVKIKEECSILGIPKKMIEANKEALEIICAESDIQYSKNISNNVCNHEYEFLKKHEPLEDSSEDDTYYYSFRCKHCGEEKYLLNSDIIEEIHKRSIEHITYELSLKKNERQFNFKLFDLIWDKFLTKEFIDNSFKRVFLEDYSLPNLNKELILINDEDLENSSIVFTNSICKNLGIFSKKIIKNKDFILSKDLNNKILFKEAI